MSLTLFLSSRRRALFLTLVAVVVTSPFAMSASAQANDINTAPVMPQIKIDREVGAARDLALEMGQNRLLVLSEPIARVSVADPKVADMKVITPTQLLLTARGVGSTDLTLWNKRDEPLVLALLVTRNLDALRRQLKDLFPGEKINVSAAGDLVVLSGEATDVRVPERAAEVAQLHAEKVANLMRVSGNQQVQLEVKFAEVSRTALRSMGINLFHRDIAGQMVTGIAQPGTVADQFLSVPGASGGLTPQIFPPSTGGGFSLFFSGLSSFPFSAILSLLEANGLSKTLAEPTLVAMSGQDAKFLAGGEFPIPVSTGLGAVGVQWKKFGIILNFTPTVVSEGFLHLKLQTEVSDVDASRTVTVGGFSIPGLVSRQSETTVRLSDGQSFAIAGLLNDQIRSQIDKIPILGDIPVLGALFRSVDYRRQESELIVVITARLTKPVEPHNMPKLPTEDELNDPNDFELFLLGSEGPSRPPEEKNDKNDKSGKNDHTALYDRTRAYAGRGPSSEVGFIR
ncbi:MAG TPA: type II and III secretion system protein family protein [Polyangia bacterium]|nr:type II and III secretion system protein family protein [Polyangia bacterium]